MWADLAPAHRAKQVDLRNLRELLKKVETASAGSPELDSGFVKAFRSAPPNVTCSTDAAVRLIETELSGWWWNCGYCAARNGASLYVPGSSRIGVAADYKTRPEHLQLLQDPKWGTLAQSLLPDLQMASARFGQLTDGERTGTLTGTSGSGTVVQLLSQMSNELGALSRTVEQSREQVTALYDQGGKHLAKMRELVSSRGPIGPRSDAFGTEATALLGVIASLQQTSIASAVKRTSDGLAAGFIAPAAGGRAAEVPERQEGGVGRGAG